MNLFIGIIAIIIALPSIYFFCKIIYNIGYNIHDNFKRKSKEVEEIKQQERIERIKLETKEQTQQLKQEEAKLQKQELHEEKFNLEKNKLIVEYTRSHESDLYFKQNLDWEIKNLNNKYNRVDFSSDINYQQVPLHQKYGSQIQGFNNQRQNNQIQNLLLDSYYPHDKSNSISFFSNTINLRSTYGITDIKSEHESINGEARVYLKDINSKRPLAVSLQTLNSMYVCSYDFNRLKFEELLDSDNNFNFKKLNNQITTFHDFYKELIHRGGKSLNLRYENKDVSETLLFKCVYKSSPIKLVSGEFKMTPSCYNGCQEYLDAIQFEEHTESEYEKQREKLYKSGIRNAIQDKNPTPESHPMFYYCIPIFEVVLN